MTPGEIAEKAYALIEDEEKAPFNELGKSTQSEYLEIAERGGDASRFGQAVREVMYEAQRAAEAETKAVLDAEADTAELPDIESFGTGLAEAAEVSNIPDYPGIMQQYSSSRLPENRSTPFPDDVPGYPRILGETENVATEEAQIFEPSAQTESGEVTAEEIVEPNGVEPVAEIEDLATEAHVRADLKAKTVPELKAICEEFEIEIPHDALEDQIIDAIVANVGTREVMAQILNKKD